MKSLYFSNKYEKASYKIFDGNEEVYEKKNTSNYYIYYPNILEKDKEYSLNMLSFKGNTINDVYYKLDSNTFSFMEPPIANYEKSTITLKNDNIKRLSIETKNGQKLENLSFSKRKDITLNLKYGEEYYIYATMEDNNGEYFISSKILADASNKEITLDKTNLRKLNINNNFYNINKLYNVKLTNSKGIEFQCFNLQETKPIYLSPDTYKVNLNVDGGALGINSYDKVIDLNSKDGVITVGDKITYNIKLNYTKTPSLGFTYDITNVKDGDTVLRDAIGVPVSNESKINVLHGDQALASNTNLINKLSGDVILRVTDSVKGIGNVNINRANLNIENNAVVVKSDINLDNIVDIYDLVLVSNHMGYKNTDKLWDPRVNLSNNDSVIDFLDLAIIARDYNKVL